MPKCAVTPRGFRIGEAAVYMGVSPWFVEQEIRDLDAYLDDASDKIA